jgi:hypothetical protein
MASPIGYNPRRVLGLEWDVDKVIVKGKEKRRIRAKGYNGNRATLLGDSIIQFISEMTSTSIQSVPGTYARDIVWMCQHGILDITRFEGVIIHTSTNDLCDTPPDEIVQIFNEIISYIREINPTCRLAVSGVLPRPCDAGSPTKLAKRSKVNKDLAALCKALNVHYIKSEKALKGKGPEWKIYRPDKLHLENFGVGLLKSYLGGEIGTLLGLPPQWDPVTNTVLPRQ